MVIAGLVLLWLSITLHELSHVVAARVLGFRLIKVTLGRGPARAWSVGGCRAVSGAGAVRRGMSRPAGSDFVADSFLRDIELSTLFPTFQAAGKACLWQARGSADITVIFTTRICVAGDRVMPRFMLLKSRTNSKPLRRCNNLIRSRDAPLQERGR